MKKLLLILAFLVLCGSAFADYKITMYLPQGMKVWIVRDYSLTEDGVSLIVPSTGKRVYFYGPYTVEEL